MATSEYISGKEISRGTHATSSAQLAKSRRLFNASVLSHLPMVFNDAVTIVFALGAALVLRAIFIDKAARFSNIPHHLGVAPLNVLYFGWFVLVYVLVARRYGLYGHLLKGTSFGHELRMTAQACLNAGMLLCGGVYMMHNLSISRTLVILLTLSAMVALCIRRSAWRIRRYHMYERGLSTRHVVILGTNHLARSLSRQIINDSRLGYTLRGYISFTPESKPPAETPGIEFLGGLDDLQRIARKHFVDEIIVTESYPTDEIIRLLKTAREAGLDVRSLSGYYNDLALNAGVEYLGAFPLVSLHRNASRSVSVAFKRAGDFAFSLLALIAVAPVMLIIAAAICLESKGPVFYISERIGRRGHVFPCFKFRTMVVNADQMKNRLDCMNERDDVLFKVKNDPRVTRVGRILRKYSLDELPQFFNVLRGEMSLVGPRPPIASEVEKYKLEHFRRLEVLPGITGLWQVQARQDASFEKYIALDTAYVENWSFWLDLKIILRTGNAVLRGTGV